MTQFLSRYFAILAIACMTTAMVQAEEVDSSAAEQASVSVSIDDSEIDAELSPSVAKTDKNTLQVNLQSDGVLSGRLRVNYTTGKMEPADAVVSFVRDDEMMETTHTDDSGHFNVDGLTPGEYTARVSIDEGSTAFYVTVAEYDADAEAESMFMDATLTPTPDYVTGEIISGDMVADGTCLGDECMGCETCGGEIIEEGIVDAGCADGSCGYIEEGYYEEPIYGEEYIVDGGMCGAACGTGCGSSCGGGFGGGCCGGGGGLGSLLGLGGLAGLAGLAGLDNDDKPVSPAHYRRYGW